MSDYESPKKRKRGTSYSEKYKQNIIKICRISRSEYIGYDGKVKAAKQVGTLCWYVEN